MSYQVVAAVVLAKDEAGRVHYVYEGGHIEWLSDEQAEHFVSEGLVVEVGSGDVADLDDATEPVDKKPLRAASKADWVAYAVSQGADEAEAEAHTKGELIDLYGG